MAMLPIEHPLYKPVNWKRTRTTMQHCGPLHKLTNTYNIDMSNVEKIPATACDPTKIGKLPFQISILEDKESLAHAAKNATEEVQVFTDGLAQEGKGRSSRYTVQEEQTRSISTLPSRTRSRAYYL